MFGEQCRRQEGPDARLGACSGRWFNLVGVWTLFHHRRRSSLPQRPSLRLFGASLERIDQCHSLNRSPWNCIRDSLLALGLKAFRNGEKWAWYTVATIPIIGILFPYIVYLGNEGFTATVWVAWPTFALFPFLGLLVSIRSFFPKKQMAAS